MKLLAISTPPSRVIAVDELEQELRHTWELYRSGALREMYARADQQGVVFVLECDTPQAAQKLLDSFPLVSAGVLSFQIIPVGPLVALEHVFGEQLST